MSSEDHTDRYLAQVQAAAERKFCTTPHELRLQSPYPEVISRLGQALPLDVILNWFSSIPNSNSSTARFPWQRVDANLREIEDNLEQFYDPKLKRERKFYYERMTRFLARTLT